MREEEDVRILITVKQLTKNNIYNVIRNNFTSESKSV